MSPPPGAFQFAPMPSSVKRWRSAACQSMRRKAAPLRSGARGRAEQRCELLQASAARVEPDAGDRPAGRCRPGLSSRRAARSATDLGAGGLGLDEESRPMFLTVADAGIVAAGSCRGRRTRRACCGGCGSPTPRPQAVSWSGGVKGCGVKTGAAAVPVFCTHWVKWIPRAPGVLAVEEKALAVELVGAALGFDVHASAGASACPRPPRCRPRSGPRGRRLR